MKLYQYSVERKDHKQTMVETPISFEIEKTFKDFLVIGCGIFDAINLDKALKSKKRVL